MSNYSLHLNRCLFLRAYPKHLLSKYQQSSSVQAKCLSNDVAKARSFNLIYFSHKYIHHGVLGFWGFGVEMQGYEADKFIYFFVIPRGLPL